MAKETKETLAEILKVLCDKYHSPCCIAAKTTGERVITVGDPSGLRRNGLIDILFEDASAIVQLNESLKRRILPQLYGQGNESCIVMKPLDDLLVGLFHQDSRSPEQLYFEGREISRRLADALGGPS